MWQCALHVTRVRGMLCLALMPFVRVCVWDSAVLGARNVPWPLYLQRSAGAGASHHRPRGGGGVLLHPRLQRPGESDPALLVRRVDGDWGQTGVPAR